MDQDCTGKLLVGGHNNRDHSKCSEWILCTVNKRQIFFHPAQPNLDRKYPMIIVFELVENWVDV